ncbi:13001_t:CDS:2 [Dentiscutata heterogama]|uniref:13001_t:CDS:1 n=1 Tax=Dentiscutata heterogama TaxID=1316150 RepID=A0ACA9JWJ3_9GLOM|nr:13001_t:CDS:2 [Dentiscutata heterogama]
MESMSNNQLPINVISGMLEQTTLANNSTQANNIESTIMTFKPHSQEFLLEIGTAQQDTSDSDDEDSQSIKEKTTNKKDTLSDPLDETENVPVIQLDANNQDNAFTLLDATDYYKCDYSYNQPSNTDDINNPWNLVSTYKFISSNGTVGNSSLIETPDDNTNLFAWFSTSILAVYFMLTGDTSAVSSWVYKNNWTLAILLAIFSFFTTIYLLNLFISLLGNAINETYNEESFLQLRGDLKKYVKSIEDDEILQDLLPAIKKITGVGEVRALKKDSEFYKIKKVIESIEVNDLNEDIAFNAIKKIIEDKDLNKDNVKDPNKGNAKDPNEGNDKDPNEDNAKDWSYDNMAPVEVSQS